MSESPLRPPPTGQHRATDRDKAGGWAEGKAPAADRRLLLALGAGGVVLLGVVGFVVLPALTPAASVSAGPVAPAAAGATAPIRTRSASPAAEVLSPAFIGAAGRDPFAALVSPPAATSTPTPSATASTAAASTAAAVPTDAATPAVPTVSATSSLPASTTTIGTPTGTPVTLLLTKVDGQSGAEVSFAGTPLHLVDGQLFHTVFRLLGAQTSSAVFQYGDVIFTLAPGQSRTFLL